jgi:hypothetical protein
MTCPARSLATAPRATELGPSEIIERERRWATPVGLVSILAVVLFAVSLVILASSFSADDDAAALREIDRDSGTFMLAYVIRAIGAALLAFPLFYLFRATADRSDAVRKQFIGLTIAAPLFLAGFAVLNALSLKDGASDFVAMGEIPGSARHVDDVAENVLEDASLRGVAAGFGFAGTISFAFAMAYTCFQAMRAGLLTRFWGSLGAAMGVASVLGQFFQFTLLYIVYLGLLFGGWTPKGRPPAWAEGRAIPWPTPGEQAAESLKGEGGEVPPGPEPGEGGGEGEPANPPRERGERRKRKRRQQEG